MEVGRYIWCWVDGKVQVGRRGQVMGTGRNTGVTAGQVRAAGFEMTGELVHCRGKSRKGKCECRNWLTL